MCGKGTVANQSSVRFSKKTTMGYCKTSEFREAQLRQLSGTDQEDVKKIKPYYESRPRSYECVRVMFHQSLHRLEVSGWYWGHITQNEALLLLKHAKVGTFLLRDSSDPRYLFSLSVRLQRSITNVRVIFKQGQFMFDCFDTDTNEKPQFDCIVKLVCYYAAVSQQRDNRAVCARSDNGSEDMLTLEKPLFRKVPTLQHLARRVINKTMTPEQQMSLRLKGTVENFMREYPFSL